MMDVAVNRCLQAFGNSLCALSAGHHGPHSRPSTGRTIRTAVHDLGRNSRRQCKECGHTGYQHVHSRRSGLYECLTKVDLDGNFCICGSFG